MEPHDMPRPSKSAFTDALALSLPIVAVAVQVPSSVVIPFTAAETSIECVPGAEVTLVITTSAPEIGGSAGCPDTSPADGGGAVLLAEGGVETDVDGFVADELSVPGDPADVLVSVESGAEGEELSGGTDDAALVPPSAALSVLPFDPNTATKITASTATIPTLAAITMYRPAPGTPFFGSVSDCISSEGIKRPRP